MRIPSKPSWLLPLLLPAALLGGCGEPESPEQAAVDLQTQKMLDSEGISLGWGVSGYLKPLGTSAMDLRFPDGSSRALFEDQVTFTGLSGEAPEVTEYPSQGVTVRSWPIADAPQTVAFEDLHLYEDFFAEVKYLKKAKFKVYLPVPTWIEYPDARKHGMLFAAKGVMKNGKTASISGLAHVSMRRHGEGTDSVWKVYEWHTTFLKTQEVEEYLFEDVLDAALADAGQLAAARRSIHEEKVREFLKDTKAYDKPHPYFRPESFDRHPGVSVVDIDRDGFDDFFVSERWGKCMLFRNQGDGSFVDVAPELGLDLDGDVASTMFADFDNDGDDDAFVGRTLQRSLYLVNEDGRFVDRTAELVEGDLPYLNSSVSVADIDNDGLLDVYLASYAGDMAQRAMNLIRYDRKDKFWSDALANFLPEEDWDEVERLFQESAPNMRFYTHRPGPPNLLLKNTGGRFVPVESPAAGIFRNTYQASWSDWDGDGDVDLYCANDFAPNNMFVNDGQGNFSEATAETGTADIGFGMGIAWGDFDMDGVQDLYVANMFSKAGRRVTSFFEQGRENYDPSAMSGSIDPVFRQMAEGNSLFRNAGGKFSKVSGMPPYERWDRSENGTMPVEEGGWAWGVQFADFDNDGCLDLYSPCGYYSAPKEAAVAVDL